MRGVVVMLGAAALVVACSTSPSPSGTGAAPSAGDFPQPAPTAPVAWTSLEQRQLIVAGAFGGDGNQFVVDAVPYGDGFVAVGESFVSDADVTARIWTSPNAIDWAVVEDPSAELTDAEVDWIASDGHRLLALGAVRGAPGGGQPTLIWSSTDARTWRRLAGAQERLANFGVAGIAGHDGVFIAWGRSRDGAATLYRTSDGADWAAIESGPFDGSDVVSVAPYRGGWIAVGAQARTEPAAPGQRPGPARAWWSPDGAHWETALVAEGPALSTVYPAAAGVLATGSSGCGGCVANANLWAGDGKAWRLLGPDRLTWPGYATDGSRIVAWDYQGGGSFAWSTDGLAWTPFGNPLTDDRSNGRFVVGAHGLLVLLSTQEEPTDAGVLYLVAS